MKHSKILKGITTILALTTIAGLGFSINKSYAGYLQEGQPILENFKYNVHPGSFEVKETNNVWNIMQYGGYQIVCIQPRSALRYTWHMELADMEAHVPHTRTGSHLGSCGGGAYHLPPCELTYGHGTTSENDYGTIEEEASAGSGGVLSPIQVSEAGTSKLSDYLAYIASETPVGEWSTDKQLAVWNSRDIPDVLTRDRAAKLDMDEGLIIGKNPPTHTGTPAIQQEAIDFAIYNYDIQKTDDKKTEVGINPVNTMVGSGEEGRVTYIPESEELFVSPFAVDYVDGDFGHIAFSGISDMYIIGYNVDGNPVMELDENGNPVLDEDGNPVPKRFDFKRINVFEEDGKTLNRTIQAEEFDYFEPAEEKDERGQKTDPAAGSGVSSEFVDVDEEAQNNPNGSNTEETNPDEDSTTGNDNADKSNNGTYMYPRPGEKFEVVLHNPNDGIEYNDTENRVVTVTVKVKFKYMQAEGEVTKLKLIKKQMRDKHGPCSSGTHSCTHSGKDWSYTHNYSCTHSCKRECKLVTLPQQYHAVIDAVRTIWEDEIDLTAGDPPKQPFLYLQLGGMVWIDAAVSKEGVVHDGVYSYGVDPDISNSEMKQYYDTGELSYQDQLLKGVEVQLYEQVDGVLNPEPIAYTVTDKNGRYMFYGLDIAKKYTLKFVYNGIMYQPTTYKQNLEGEGSNITEEGSDRDEFNENFAEIQAYPNNYKVRTELFKKPGEWNKAWAIEDLSLDFTEAGTEGETTETATEVAEQERSETYQLYEKWIDRACEIVEEQHKDVKTRFLAFRDEGEEIANPFVIAAKELGDTEENQSRLQFFMDTRIDSWTGVNGNAETEANLTYYPIIPDGFVGYTPKARREADDPATGSFWTAERYKTIATYDGVKDSDPETIGEFTMKVPTVDGNGNPTTVEITVPIVIYNDDRETYPPTSTEMIIGSTLRIDAGLIWRNQFDLSLKKDVYTATLKINGKTQVYTYNSRNLQFNEAMLNQNSSPSINGKTVKDTTWDIEVRESDAYYSTEYLRELFKTDYFYKRTDYKPGNKTDSEINAKESTTGITESELLEGLKKGSELEIYVTYKLAIRNQSQSILGSITEVVDYYDETYIYEPNLSFATYVTGTAKAHTEDAMGTATENAGIDFGNIFKENKVSQENFYEAMKQEFVIENRKTYYKKDKEKTIKSYFENNIAKEIKDSENSIYTGPGSQKDLEGYNELYITIPEDKENGEKKLSPGETLYLYLTFRVDRENKKDDVLDGGYLDIENAKVNTAEINGYKTYYTQGTQLPNSYNTYKHQDKIEGNGPYTVTSEELEAGLIDRDSTPGNVVDETLKAAEGGDYSLFEDDTDQAPHIKFEINEQDIRKLNGVVWEDERNKTSGEAVIGDGIKDNGEENIQGVTVQLIEITQKDNGEEIYETVWQEETTNDSGYEFEKYIPGNYYVKFIYGNKVEQVYALEDIYGENKNPVTEYLNETAKNSRSINGHDYKSTAYQTTIEQDKDKYTRPVPFIRGEQDEQGNGGYQVTGFLNYGSGEGTYTDVYGNKNAEGIRGQSEVGSFIYDIGAADANENAVSDAKDIGSMRDNVVTYSKDNIRNHVAEVLASPYKIPTYKENKTDEEGKLYSADEQENLLQELVEKTPMAAISGVIDIEMEYNRTNSIGEVGQETEGNPGTITYKRVETVNEDGTKVEKGEPNGEYTIAGLDLGLEERPEAQLTVNKTIFEIDIKDSTGNSLFNSQNLEPVANLAWLKNPKSNLVDWKNPEKRDLLVMDHLGDSGLIQPSIDEETMKGMVVTITYDITIKNDSEVDYIESEFYYTGKNGQKVSETQVNNMLDYVDVNLRFVKDLNESWKMVQMNEGKQNDYTGALVETGLLNNNLKGYVDNDFEQIIQLEKELGSMIPGAEQLLKLTLTQTITAEDLEAVFVDGNVVDEDGKLVFDNITELVETSNTLGRRMAFSVVGNQEPIAGTNLSPKEIDAAIAEQLNLLGPYGTTRPTMYIALATVVLAIIIGGIILIKKKVLK